MSVPEKKKMTTKLQIEALLFSSGKTMTEEQLMVLTRLDARTVKKALLELQKDYEDRDSAIAVFGDDTGWKMMVRELYAPVIKNIVAETELTRACMETLAVIAYKYPKAVQSEVIDIRGGGAYEHMAELERLGFISREPQGRSYTVKLTEKFFNYFEVAGGKDIRDVFKKVKLPTPLKMEGQKTLGSLEIVPAGKDTPKEHPKKIDGMQVVDVEPKTEEKTEPASKGETREDFEKGEDSEAGIDSQEADEQEETQKIGFLDDLDAKIAKLRQRNDDNDKDETLKRKPLPGAEGMDSEQSSEGQDSGQKDEDSDKKE